MNAETQTQKYECRTQTQNHAGGRWGPGGKARCHPRSTQSRWWSWCQGSLAHRAAQGQGEQLCGHLLAQAQLQPLLAQPDSQLRASHLHWERIAPAMWTWDSSEASFNGNPFLIPVGWALFCQGLITQRTEQGDLSNDEYLNSNLNHLISNFFKHNTQDALKIQKDICFTEYGIIRSFI